jgi:hypothetical protein
MGTSNVTLTGDATANPTVTFSKSGSKVSSWSSSLGTSTSAYSVRPGTTVTFTVTAGHSGTVFWTYYTPSVSSTGGISIQTTSTSGGELWTEKTYNYSFTMGTSNATITMSAS